jgi:hypothetical protein
MTDQDRLPRKWTYAVVAAWAVTGWVALVTWQDTAWWLALLVCLGLAGVTITAMHVWPRITRRPATSVSPSSQPDLDRGEADPIALYDVAVMVSKRISSWIDAELDDRAREYAKGALEIIGAIRKLIDESYVADTLSGAALRTVHLSMHIITKETTDKPRGAGDWRTLKKTLETEHTTIDNAVNSGGQ